MSSSSSPVWFITGSSSGLGLSLTLYALRQGHRVIATSRNPSKTPELVTQVEALGGSWLALDVTSDESTLKVVVEKAIAVHGRIDVLVNNAGYSILGAIEDIRYNTTHQFTYLLRSLPFSDLDLVFQAAPFPSPYSISRPSKHLE
jgi:NAD(P)-dependent dehydrogenase (short-subunit alcohol dehydrogenase family)